MIDFSEFGKRIHKLRKSRTMTQEELAARLGVSGQAVSKWENGTSYPDISLMPTLAVIFETSIDALFGVEKKEPIKAALPAQYEGYPLVHQYEAVGCYSNKTVKSIDGSGVYFTDGSTAELSTRMVVNNGMGEVRMYFEEGFFYDRSIDYSKTSVAYEFDTTRSLEVSIKNNRVDVVQSEDQKTRVFAQGHPVFIDRLEALVSEDTLMVRFKQRNDEKMGSYQENSVRIEVPYDRGASLSAAIHGSGTYRGLISYAKGVLAIHGSGSIDTKDIDTFSASIHGSGDVTVNDAKTSGLTINGAGELKGKNLGEVKLSINGSGDVIGSEISSLSAVINGSGNGKFETIEGGDVSIEIHGSGDLELKQGRCDRFGVKIIGSGEVNAEGVVAKTANIVLEQNGEVVLGTVKESSVEQIKQKGTIRILKRGAEAQKDCSAMHG